MLTPLRLVLRCSATQAAIAAYGDCLRRAPLALEALHALARLGVPARELQVRSRRHVRHVR